MQGPARQARVMRLREAIERIERRRDPAGADPAPEAGRGEAPPFARLDAGAVHEIVASGPLDAGAALGFALGQLQGLVSPRRPALLWLCPRHEGRRGGLVYAPGLDIFGLAPGAVVQVGCRTPAELMWAAEAGASSPAPAGVVVQGFQNAQAPDFTASRRLALRCRDSGTPVLILRQGAARIPSAARTRWAVRAHPARPDPFDAAAPGAPRWRAVLEKAPRGQRGAWVLSWSGTGFVEDTDDGTVAKDTVGAPPSGAAFPFLGQPVAQGERGGAGGGPARPGALPSARQRHGAGGGG